MSALNRGEEDQTITYTINLQAPTPSFKFHRIPLTYRPPPIDTRDPLPTYHHNQCKLQHAGQCEHCRSNRREEQTQCQIATHRHRFPKPIVNPSLPSVQKAACGRCEHSHCQNKQSRRAPNPVPNFTESHKLT